MKLNLTLQTTKWVGFDLDNTLHDYIGASTTALNAVFQLLEATSSINPEEARASYIKILADATQSAFSDRTKTSRDFRSERFSRLLQTFDKDNPDLIEKILDTYESNLDQNLRLYEGAIELITHFKNLGLNIALITEGPEDAQKRAVQRLGIQPLIDRLFTSNAQGISKIDGLFSTVLRELGIQAEELLVIGDSFDRDIQPATALGIPCIHLTSGQSVHENTCSSLAMIRVLSR